MNRHEILKYYRQEVESIREAGLYKGEAPFVSPQGAYVTLEDGRRLLCMCANNYLGLGDNPRLIEAAKRTYDDKGYGVASVRFICGTQELHKTLEARIAGFIGTDDAILYSSCFDANGGLFETLLGPEDAVVSDELNHASIIDGIRLCKAKRYRYRNSDMDDLRLQLIPVRPFAFFKDRVGGMQIHFRRSGDQAHHLVQIRHQLPGVPGPAGIISGGLNSAGQRLGRIGVKSAHIVSLPAVQGNGNRFQGLHRGIGIDPEGSVTFSGFFVAHASFPPDSN
jgi:hypothetical protein